jgi:hypothetical protein
MHLSHISPLQIHFFDCLTKPLEDGSGNNDNPAFLFVNSRAGSLFGAKTNAKARFHPNP